VVVWGDRYEAFAALVASTQMGIPTAHAEGGDYTEGGALDDSVRHAMTKLAHLHLTTNADSAERVRRLGEEAWRVHDVGLPVLDLVVKGRYATRGEVTERLGLELSRPILVFSQHPVATEHQKAAEQVRPSLAALEEAAHRWGAQTVITYPNDDPGGRLIVDEIAALAGRGVPGLVVRPSLGRHLYHGVLALASACVGNSSSGIKETPSFHCPCVNIGPRQRGRLRAENVIDVGYSRGEILAAIERCLTDGTFREQVRACVSPYGGGDAGRRVAELLATVELGPALIQKKLTY
jgi:UDP-N-acetylglucosamine 2-epimerase (non-hydrolysing)/GDP/UDP-N,N'-diacetylbacillosamine 2-epimerase (hydrolysing)